MKALLGKFLAWAGSPFNALVNEIDADLHAAEADIGSIKNRLFSLEQKVFPTPDPKVFPTQDPKA